MGNGNEPQNVMNLKGLGDMRTALTTRIHSKPPQKGTAHRDLHILGKERDRLETELMRLERQRKRGQKHLAEILQTIAKLQQEAQIEDMSLGTSADPGDGNRCTATPEYTRRQWKTMSVDY